MGTQVPAFVHGSRIIQSLVSQQRGAGFVKPCAPQLLPAGTSFCSLLQLSGLGREDLRKPVPLSSVFRVATHGQHIAEISGPLTTAEATAEADHQSVGLHPYEGEEGVWSIIIPTYNRLPILTKCLEALEDQRCYVQSGVREYEVIVVDDGSTDGTVDFLAPPGAWSSAPLHVPLESGRYNHVRIVRQQHAGKLVPNSPCSGTKSLPTVHPVQCRCG